MDEAVFNNTKRCLQKLKPKTLPKKKNGFLLVEQISSHPKRLSLSPFPTKSPVSDLREQLQPSVSVSIISFPSSSAVAASRSLLLLAPPLVVLPRLPLQPAFQLNSIPTTKKGSEKLVSKSETSNEMGTRGEQAYLVDDILPN